METLEQIRAMREESARELAVLDKIIERLSKQPEPASIEKGRSRQIAVKIEKKMKRELEGIYASYI